jgi:hypothetical protein
MLWCGVGVLVSVVSLNITNGHNNNNNNVKTMVLPIIIGFVGIHNKQGPKSRNA